jgi:hypothetical protein
MTLRARSTSGGQKILFKATGKRPPGKCNLVNDLLNSTSISPRQATALARFPFELLRNPNPESFDPRLLNQPKALRREGVGHLRQNTCVLDFYLHFPTEEIH